MKERGGGERERKRKREEERRETGDHGIFLEQAVMEHIIITLMPILLGEYIENNIITTIAYLCQPLVCMPAGMLV